LAVASRDEEVRAVVAELDALLGALGANVDALNGILTGRDRDHGQEATV
jgi:hypothetical protein